MIKLLTITVLQKLDQTTSSGGLIPTYCNWPFLFENLHFNNNT